MSLTYENLYEAFLSDPASLEEAVANDLAISSAENLDDYLRSQAERYFAWAALASIAEARAARQKYIVQDELWPMAKGLARQLLDTSGAKVTEARLDETASFNDTYRQGRQLLVELEKVAGVLRGAERAMHQRLEMLRSINSRQRVELGTIPDDDLVSRAKAAISTKRTRAAKQ